jgi:hypothetical protein
MMLVSAFVMYNFFSLSKWYHEIKEQDTIKLTAIYAMVEIFDRLLGAFGDRNMNLLSSKAGNIIETFIYMILHTFDYFIGMIVFEVALNADLNTLVQLLIINNVLEVKIVVFKKSDLNVLFNYLYYDVNERIHFVVYFLIMICR